MSIVEASQYLLKWFGSNHSFELNRDYKKLLIVSEDDEQAIKAAINIALSEFETAKVIKSHEFENKTERKKYWILNKPFSAYDQSVTLDLNTCINISDIINAYCEKIKNFQYVSDPLNIQSLDVQKLAYICSMVLGLNDEKKTE